MALASGNNGLVGGGADDDGSSSNDENGVESNCLTKIFESPNPTRRGWVTMDSASSSAQSGKALRTSEEVCAFVKCVNNRRRYR